jgi:CBS domain-containing protein
MWGITGNLRKATRWASGLGQGLAWLLIVGGIAMVLGLRVPFFGSGLTSGLWLAFIGWFLRNAAVMSYRRVLLQESLEDVPVSRVMRRAFVSVASDMPVGALVDDLLMRTDQRAFPVMEAGRFVGLVCLDDVRKVRREAWITTLVREIMTPASALTQVTPSEDAAEAMEALARRGVDQLPVVEAGEVRGLLRREDILRWLSVYGARGLAR